MIERQLTFDDVALRSRIAADTRRPGADRADPVRTSDGGWSEHALRYPNALPLPQRKQRGAWFTPMALALPTARRTLEPLLMAGPATTLRICDPAVGGGTFLLAALRVLTERGFEPMAASRGLVGLDLDGEAARLAALAIAEAGGTSAELRCGDGLRELEPQSFDCVLTNPPWETLQTGPDAKARVAELRPHFEHQGRGKLYTYRLFVERAVQLLRPGGRLGLIVPASLWFDRDAEPLRRLLLDTCDWQWLFGFENREKVFAIDSRYRFGVVLATKGGTTKRVHVAFGRTSLGDWSTDRPQHVVYQRDELGMLSQHSGAFVEVEHRRDLDILRRMQQHGRPLLGPDGAFVWRQGDFNMTSDRGQFLLRAEAERRGYRHDGCGVFRAPGEPDLLPLVQGAMVYDLHGNHGAHQDGTGHKTSWRRPTDLAELRPLYLVDAENWRCAADTRPAARIVLRALSNATNERTSIACLLPDLPCGNSLGVLSPRAISATPLRNLAVGAAILSSLPFDWSLRLRLGGTNLNGFVLADCVLPRLDDASTTRLANAALRLCAIAAWHAGLLQLAQQEAWCDQLPPAVDANVRRHLQTEIDLLVGTAFGLTHQDVTWITRGCGDDEPSFHKGFWRVDRDLPKAERRPARWLLALAQR